MEAIEKNEMQATNFRSQGNQKFAKGNCFNALLFYNKSLCFASNPEGLSLCYANRAAVFLHLKLYDRCLNNIKLARKNYPKDKTKKLDGREEKCLKEYLAALNTKPDTTTTAEDFLKLSYPANPKLPFAAECLEMRENEKFGRHIITNRNLKAGDIVAITPNIFNVINRSARFHHCSFCLRSNDMDLLPCPDCPRAMYCSRRCMVEDKDECHLAFCRTSKTPEPRYVLIRLMQSPAAKVFCDSIAELSKYDAGTKSVFDFDFNCCRNPISCKNLMHAASGGSLTKLHVDIGDILSDFMPKFNEEDLTSLNTTMRLSVSEDFFFLFSINSSSIISESDSWGQNYQDTFISIIGWTFHPLSLVFNTSCHPNLNLVNFCEQGVTAWMVKYPIKAGEQLFIHYLPGNEWFNKSKSDRKRFWTETYGFKCECEACVNGWKIQEVPNYQNMKINVPNNLPTRGEALKMFKENCNYINKHYKKEYPSGKLRQFKTKCHNN